MKFLHPAKLDKLLMSEMTAYENKLKEAFPGASVSNHCDWSDPVVDAGKHLQDSQHHEGTAIDFHVIGVPPLAAWLWLERFKFTGIGYYPDWKPVPGFHADVRKGVAFRARWARAGSLYVNFDEAIVSGILNNSQGRIA